MSLATASLPVICHRRFAESFDPADVAVSFAAQSDPAILESVCDTAGYGRFSLYFCAAVDRVRVPANSPVAVESALNRICSPSPGRPVPSVKNLPMVAGWVGHVSYEAGAALENVLRDDCDLAGAAALDFALYDSAVLFDRHAGTWHIAAVDLPESVVPADQRVARLAQMLKRTPGAAHRVRKSAAQQTTPPTPDLSREDYLERVRRALDYIAAGDIYQVNLTQRFTARTEASPAEIYLRMRASNPADFAALLPREDHAIICASPELFLSASPDGRVVTRPIKGTRPRARTPVADAALGRELRASEKDRAELNMITDLLRNDLGRVCGYGTVRVEAEADVEIHPTVLHLVSTISGELRSEVTRAELLRACLPGGSITGCPKIRAMQIIRELEPTPRGVYCGAIGYVGLDGLIGLNVAIRTMTHRSDERGAILHLHAGGAITADSDPHAEYAEILAKAEGMFRALGHSTSALDSASAVG